MSKADPGVALVTGASRGIGRATAKALKDAREAIHTGDAPEVVGAVVVKAATASVPRRRYTAGKMARQIWSLRRFGSEAAFDRSLRRQMRLPV